VGAGSAGIGETPIESVIWYRSFGIVNLEYRVL